MVEAVVEPDEDGGILAVIDECTVEVVFEVVHRALSAIFLVLVLVFVAFAHDAPHAEFTVVDGDGLSSLGGVCVPHEGVFEEFHNFYVGVEEFEFAQGLSRGPSAYEDGGFVPEGVEFPEDALEVVLGVFPDYSAVHDQAHAQVAVVDGEGVLLLVHSSGLGASDEGVFEAVGGPCVGVDVFDRLQDRVFVGSEEVFLEHDDFAYCLPSRPGYWGDP